MALNGLICADVPLSNYSLTMVVYCWQGRWAWQQEWSWWWACFLAPRWRVCPRAWHCPQSSDL